MVELILVTVSLYSGFLIKKIIHIPLLCKQGGGAAFTFPGRMKSVFVSVGMWPQVSISCDSIMLINIVTQYLIAKWQLPEDQNYPLFLILADCNHFFSL